MPILFARVVILVVADVTSQRGFSSLKIDFLILSIQFIQIRIHIIGHYEKKAEGLKPGLKDRIRNVINSLLPARHGLIAVA